MPSRRAFLNNRRAAAWFTSAFALLLLVMPRASGAQSPTPKKSAPAREQKSAASPRVSLSPRYVPGQVYRYAMEFETSTSTTQSGFSADPQGPSSLVITWDATIRMEVLPAEGAAGGIRLRTTYEKSAANIRADTFDPTADATIRQYKDLEGKVVEFTLDAAGKVKSVTGLEGIVAGEKAAQAARDWINHLDAGSGAPPGGVTVGETWTSDQPAISLPVAGLVWRTDSQYLRKEPCHPPNPDLPPSAASTDSSAAGLAAESCAVILTHLNLVRPRPVRDATPEDYRKNGVQTKGAWHGSGQSLIYVALRSGAVVSVSQTGSEDMDVTLTSNHNNTSMRYAGTVQSRSQVEMIGDEGQGK
ncbi:MAG: hypothetical protein LAO19_12335 [Acidobacteriia bacterium]|nr:hypothetical protein [Terriglobia bacterium]